MTIIDQISSAHISTEEAREIVFRGIADSIAGKEANRAEVETFGQAMSAAGISLADVQRYIQHYRDLEVAERALADVQPLENEKASIRARLKEIDDEVHRLELQWMQQNPLRPDNESRYYEMQSDFVRGLRKQFASETIAAQKRLNELRAQLGDLGQKQCAVAGLRAQLAPILKYLPDRTA